MMDRRRPAQLILVAIALALAVALVSAAGADAVTRARADRIALEVLRPQRVRGPVVVFGLRAPVRRGAWISQAGRVRGNSPRTRRHLRRAVWLFWEDPAVGETFEHPTTLLLLDARSGRVVRRQGTSWWPLIDGRRAAFVVSPAAFRSGRYRVYASPTARATAAAVPRQASDVFAPPDIPSPPPLPPQDCMVTLTDAGARHDPGIEPALKVLDEMQGTLGLGRSQRFDAHSNPQLNSALDAAERAGCTHLLLVVAAHGYSRQDSREARCYLGTSPKDGKPIYGSQSSLDFAIARHPRTTFSVLVFSCFGGRWLGGLGQLPNVAVAAASSAPDRPTWGPTWLETIELGLEFWRQHKSAQSATGGSFEKGIVEGVSGALAGVNPETHQSDMPPPMVNRTGFVPAPSELVPAPSELPPVSSPSSGGAPIAAQPGSCPGAGGFDSVLHGQAPPGESSLGWGAGELDVTANDGSPPQSAAVGYDSESVGHFGGWKCGTTVTLTARPARGSHFDHWASPQGACAGAGPVCTWTAGDSNAEIDVYFTLTTFPLTVDNGNPVGGLVGSDGDDVTQQIDCGNFYNGPQTIHYTTCSTTARQQQADDDFVNLTFRATATPAQGYWKIASISGCQTIVYTSSSGRHGETIAHTGATCQVPVNGPTTVSVSWTKVE